MAVHDIGLSPEQFWRLTPAKFSALYEKHKIAVQQADYRAGLIASILYNVHRGDQPSRTAASFFTSLQEFDKDEEENSVKVEKVMTADQQQSLLEALFGSAPD